MSNKCEKETIKHHLEGVAKLCKIYSSAFGEKDNGEFLGIMHDIGKYSENFQKVLDKKIN